MLKALALTLTGMFLIIGSDYAGQNGLSIWLAIPLGISYLVMVAILIRAFINNR